LSSKTASGVAKAREAEKLIRTIVLEASPMTPESFKPYGEMISERGEVEIDIEGGCPCVLVQTVEKRHMSFDFLGRHLKTEQVFSPLGGAKSVIAVAPPSREGKIDIKRLVAFTVDGNAAYKLHRGTWHTSAFPLDERASFLVLEREGTLEDDHDLRDLKIAHGVVVEIQFE
jgi:ureidoglycolate hydrolase